jgi:hypothetical protein
MNDTTQKQTSSDTLYVLIDDAADVEKFGGPKEINADKLGEHLLKFSDAISRALEKCKSLAGQFDLKEVSLEAKLTAEFGFVLVSKAAVEEAVTLKFERRPPTGR